VGKQEIKRQLGRPTGRLEDNIKMYLRKTGFGGLEWIHLAPDKDKSRAFVDAVINGKI
jgi:hypothetical protein